MKGAVRIGGSLAIGIVIILGALSVKSSAGTELTGSVIVAPAPERPYIEAPDSDGDGITDWEESLGARVADAIDTASTTGLAVSDEPYEPPTTFTGKFSEAFFKDYLEGKIQGQDFTDPTAFIGTAIEAIEKNTQSKRHSRLEFAIVPDSDESLHLYGNRVAEIIQTHSIDNENEAIILQKALTANDPKILEALVPIHDVYAGMIADSLEIEVPSALSDKHLALVNAYENIRTDIEAMQLAFTDPLYSLARVKDYQNHALGLFTALESIADVLNQHKVFYTSDDPGIFFYSFDI